MAKGNLPLIGLTAAAFVLPACTHMLWKVTYPGPDNYYSQAQDVILDSQQNIIMTGQTLDANDNSALFIAHYQDDGSLNWDYVVPGFRNHSPPRGNNYIAANSGNSIFYAGYNNQQIYTYGLLSPSGEPLWDNTVYTPALTFIQDVDITINNIYLLLTNELGAVTLNAYSGSGETLWSFSPYSECAALGCTDPDIGVDLDDYYANGPAPAPLFTSSEIAVLNDIIILNNSEELLRITETGEESGLISASSLGTNQFVDLSENNQLIGILARDNEQHSIHILTPELEELNRTIIPENLNDGLISLGHDDTLCIATISGDTLSVGAIKQGNILWESNDEADFFYRELIAVKAINGNCHISTAESEDYPQVTQYTRVYSHTGELVKTIATPDFIAHSVESTENAVYSAGISGSYDALEGTQATLFKHRLQ